MPMGACIERPIGHSDLDILAEAGFFPVFQMGHRITLQRSSGRQYRFHHL
jgi:hypothetical protein